MAMGTARAAFVASSDMCTAESKEPVEYQSTMKTKGALDKWEQKSGKLWGILEWCRDSQIVQSGARKLMMKAKPEGQPFTRLMVVSNVQDSANFHPRAEISLTIDPSLTPERKRGAIPPVRWRAYRQCNEEGKAEAAQ